MSDLIDKAEALAFIAKEMKDARQTYSGFGQAQEALRFAEQMLTAGFAALPAPDLTDPVTVHANMLRGTVAKPTVEQIIHLYGADALFAALAALSTTEASHE